MRETMWAMEGSWSNGRRFLYAGTHLTRRGCIEEFCRNRRGEATRDVWRALRKQGNRPVKVTLTWRSK